MMTAQQANGHFHRVYDPADPDGQLQKARHDLELARLKLELKRTNERRAAVQAREVLDASEWWQPYVELLTRFGNEAMMRFGGLGWSLSQQGSLAPLIRTEQDLNILRTPARITFWANPYAQGLYNGLQNYVIAEGFTYQAEVQDDILCPGLKEAYQKIIDEHLERNQWGANGVGEDDAPSMEREAFGRFMVDGEFLMYGFPASEGYTDCRVFEPMQLTKPPGGHDIEWSFGVKTKKDDWQTPLAYHIQWEPGQKGDEYPADDFVHLKNNVWRTSKRGLTDFSYGMLDALRLANVLRGNMGDAAAQQAAIVAVEQRHYGTPSEWSQQNSANTAVATTDPFTGQSRNYSFQERGQTRQVGEGFEYVTGPGAQYNAPNFNLVLQTLLRAAAVKYNAPEWLVSSDPAAANYATSLTVNSLFVQAVKGTQKRIRGPLRKSVQQATERRVRYLGKLVGRKIDRRTGETTVREYDWKTVLRLCKVKVVCPDPVARDPLQLTQQRDMELRDGVLSPQGWAAEVGRDYEQIASEIEEHRERFPSPESVMPSLGDILPGEAPPQ